ncbi:sensor histidine kinase [Marinicellulosiphila megalodicopiae]|uniref:sensor histidine kinase n=1 Tax=Marinicellulosiphila megalodicopiae TaxID=2724896 RepID=UPI003BB145E4
MFGFKKNNDKITKFYELTTQLSYAGDISQLSYLAIDYALNNLGFDRLGVLLYDKQNDKLKGTWGTDRDGVLRNEEDLSIEISYDHRIQMDADKYKGIIDVQEDRKLYDGTECVGKGWHASIVIFHKNECQGWIFSDNLISQKPITDELLETLKLFGAIVSQLLVRIQSQKQFSEINLDLENQNSFLEKTMEKLSYAQDQIIESEKLSALGRLVQGISEELADPLTDSLNATTEFKTIVDSFFTKQLEGNLSDSDMRDFHQSVGTLFNKINKNQSKASRLLGQFQTIASNQTDDSIREVEIDTVIPDLIDNIKQVNKALQHEFIVVSETEVKAKLQISLLTQVFNQLVTNSLQHGFPGLDTGIIKILITTDRNNKRLIIQYSDNGKGDSTNLENLYDPFSQTQSKKGLGLGTFIIYNLIVQRMNGFIEATNQEGGGLHYKITIPIDPT